MLNRVQELCLHPVVAAGVDPVVVLEAAQALAPRQALALLRYLAAWLRLHDQVPPASSPWDVFAALLGLSAKVCIALELLGQQLHPVCKSPCGFDVMALLMVCSCRRVR